VFFATLLQVPVHLTLFEDTGPHIIIIGYTLGRKTLLSGNANALKLGPKNFSD
jgi:hypothetical protein